jgi:hypothetical protein
VNDDDSNNEDGVAFFRGVLAAIAVWIIIGLVAIAIIAGLGLLKKVTAAELFVMEGDQYTVVFEPVADVELHEVYRCLEDGEDPDTEDDCHLAGTTTTGSLIETVEPGTLVYYRARAVRIWEGGAKQYGPFSEPSEKYRVVKPIDGVPGKPIIINIPITVEDGGTVNIEVGQ